MYIYIYIVCIYIYIYISGGPSGAKPQNAVSRRAMRRKSRVSRSLLTASRRGQDKRGRRRSAAIPPNQLSGENVGKMLQDLTTCDNMWQHMTNGGNTSALKATHGKMWQRARTQSNTCQNSRNLWPFCENPVRPDPVWKPAIHSSAYPNTNASHI